MDEKVLDFAEKQGLNPPKYLMQWNGYDVYQLVFEPTIINGMSFYKAIGYPQFILSNKQGVRMTTYDEGFEILDMLPDED